MLMLKTGGKYKIKRDWCRELLYTKTHANKLQIWTYRREVRSLNYFLVLSDSMVRTSVRNITFVQYN